MNVRGIGVDVVDVGRIEALLERRPAFARRVFSDAEIAYCDSQGAGRARCYAARWAAREACAKALGGVPDGRWRDVRVVGRQGGAVGLELDGAVRSRADAIGVREVLVSLSHERDTAVAYCVAVGPAE